MRMRIKHMNTFGNWLSMPVFTRISFFIVFSAVKYKEIFFVVVFRDKIGKNKMNK